MINTILIDTVNQKISQFLAKYSDKEFHEREIARRVGVASGSANRALNELYASGTVKRRQAGKMLFYTINQGNPALTSFKRLVNIMLVEPLMENLKSVTHRIVLYGSCARGTDNSKSDMDLFIVTSHREKVLELLNDFHFPSGYEDIHVQAVIKAPAELLAADESEQSFLNEVEQGVTLWESSAHES